MTTNRTFRVLILASLLLTLVACGGGPASEGESAEGGGEAAASEGRGSDPASVTMADLAYSPAEVEIGAGGSVTWTNEEDAPHTVTFDDDTVADSEELNNGDEFSTTFDTAGTYSYICAIHPDMKGTVTVS